MAKPNWDELEPADLARLRERRLRRQVRFQLYAYSDYYRKLMDELELQADGFAGTVDLPKLPTVDRASIAASPKAFVLKPSKPLVQRWGSSRQVADVVVNKLLRGLDEADRLLRHDYEPVFSLWTSGATGEVIEIQMTRRDLSVMATQGARMLGIAGVAEGDAIVNLLETSHSGAFWPVWAGGVALGCRQVAPGMVDPKEAVDVARRIEASAMVVLPTDALGLLEAGGEEGIPSLKTIILGPQQITPSLRLRLDEGFGTRVRLVSTYGFAEARTVWAECHQGAGNDDAGFHVMPDLEIVEALSQRAGGPAREGQPGEVVYTGLDQRGTALARYAPGDVAMGGVVTGRCPYCGRNVDRIVGPIRRSENLLELQFAGSDLLAVDVEVLAAALAHPGVKAWQVEVTKVDEDPRGADELFIYFQPAGRNDPARLAVELDQMVRAEVGFSPTQFVLSERAAGGVVDLRPVPVGGSRASRNRLSKDGAPVVRLWRNPPAKGDANGN